MITSTLTTIVKANWNRLFCKPVDPKHLTYTPTWRCNLKCMMCDVWKMEARENDEFTASDVDRMFDDRRLRKLDVLKIAGGEPFLKEDLPEIVEAIHRRTGFKLLHLTTNGTLTDEIADFVKVMGDGDIDLRLKVSVDGVGTLHDEIRGNGCLEKVMATLEKLREMQLSGHRFDVAVVQTVLGMNMDEIEKVRELVRDRGHGHTVTMGLSDRPLWNGHEATEPWEYRTFDEFSEQEVERVVLQLKVSNLSFAEKLMWEYSFKGIKHRLARNKNAPNPRCMNLFTSVRLQPNGDLIICSYFPEPLGNLTQRTFSEIWESDVVKEKRREVVKKCRGCWLNCETVPNAVYSGDIFKNLI